VTTVKKTASGKMIFGKIDENGRASAPAAAAEPAEVR
jgi:hypothetical protein